MTGDAYVMPPAGPSGERLTDICRRLREDVAGAARADAVMGRPIPHQCPNLDRDRVLALCEAAEDVTRQRDEAVKALHEIKRLLSYSRQYAVSAFAAEANTNQAWHVAVLAIDSAEARP